MSIVLSSMFICVKRWPFSVNAGSILRKCFPFIHLVPNNCPFSYIQAKLYMIFVHFLVVKAYIVTVSAHFLVFGVKFLYLHISLSCYQFSVYKKAYCCVNNLISFNFRSVFFPIFLYSGLAIQRNCTYPCFRGMVTKYLCLSLCPWVILGHTSRMEAVRFVHLCVFRL